VLELFRRLDRVPLSRRESDVFRAQAMELHQMLDLEAEHFCSIVSVLDRRDESHRLPGCCAYTDWMKTHAVRLQLLAAVKETENADRRSNDRSSQRGESASARSPDQVLGAGRPEAGSDT
jgi:hypothetical protein